MARHIVDVEVLQRGLDGLAHRGVPTPMVSATPTCCTPMPFISPAR
jgi:hypothetical protein